MRCCGANRISGGSSSEAEVCGRAAFDRLCVGGTGLINGLLVSHPPATISRGMVAAGVRFLCSNNFGQGIRRSLYKV